MFTGLFDGKTPGEYPYLSMEAEEEAVLRRERLSYERMGREVSFRELPAACRRRVLDVYRELWDL